MNQADRRAKDGQSHNRLGYAAMQFPLSRRSTLTLCLGGAALAALLGGFAYFDRAAGVPTHYVSHQLCSAVFVGGLDPQPVE